MKFKNIIFGVSTFFHSLFRGMRAADDLLTTSTITDNGTEINKINKGTGVMADMLKGEVTQEVEEYRDKYYRVLREADKYKVTIGDNGEVNAKKKELTELLKHPPVYLNDDEKIVLIQDNFNFPKSDSDTPKYSHGKLIANSLYDFDTTIEIKRNGFIPRFKIEKFTKKIVIKKRGEERIIDFYLPMYASQFGKIDAILVAELNNLFTSKARKSDIFDFDGLEFITDRPWPSAVNKKYEYDNIRYDGIDVFDGSFVVHVLANPILEDFDITEKYKTKALDEKYEKEAPVNEECVDIEALLRKNNRNLNKTINLSTQKLKLS